MRILSLLSALFLVAFLSGCQSTPPSQNGEEIYVNEVYPDIS